jgi:microcystin-dependent protein
MHDHSFFKQTTMEGIIGFTTIFAGNYAPPGWAICDGSLLPIMAHPQLFSVIGTTYGGDGIKTFALPDLRGRAIAGAETGSSDYKPGYKGGTETQGPLKTKHIPAHTHTLQMTMTPKAALVANATSPSNAVYAINSNQQMYNYDTNTQMGPFTAMITTSAIGTIDPQPIPILHPVLALNYIICIGRP